MVGGTTEVRPLATTNVMFQITATLLSIVLECSGAGEVSCGLAQVSVRE